MVTVVTREANGIPLTHDQVDSNFTNLADAVNNIGGDILGPAIAAKDAAVSAANSANLSAQSATNSANAASISRGNAAAFAEQSAASAVESASYVGSLGNPPGSSHIGFDPGGVGSVPSNVETKLRESRTPQDKGAIGDGSANDTASLEKLIADTPQRGCFTSPHVTNYKLTNSITVFGKAGAVMDFGNQQYNFASMTSPQNGFHFQAFAEGIVKNIFVIGSKTNTTVGVLFGAASGQITIHANIGKVRVSECGIGVQIGVDEWQLDDVLVEDIYASDCDTGIKITGKNTLAMIFQKVAAYQNSQIGVHIEAGGGFIASLLPAGNPNNLFFGRTDGRLHGELSRWDIASGYSEMGTAGEVWINSASCTDDNPFTEEIIIGGYRSTPFTVTNVSDFVQWRLNGDLRIRGNINHGQQEPVIMLDHNIAYRAPSVFLDGVIDCRPYTDDLGNVTRQVPMSYRLTHPSQAVEINARVNNGVSFWNNDGAVNEGVIKSGIYMSKLAVLESALLDIANLMGAWTLRDVSSGTARNLVRGAPVLTASEEVVRRDIWFDDGLIGFFRGPGATSKILSTGSSVFAVSAAYSFFTILRPTTTGSSEENTTNIGGALGMRNALYNGALLCLVGGANAFASPTNPYDAHAVVGRYESGISIKVDAINLRTGEVLSGVTVSGVPIFTSLTWVNGVNMRNNHTVRGATAVIARAMSDVEVSRILQAATALTSTWVV